MEILDATSGRLMQTNNVQSLLDSCRICMAHHVHMNDLFNTGSHNIIEQIQYCTGISLDHEDCFPSKICSQCLKDLSIAHKFKSSCLLADNTFRKLVSQGIKKEITGEKDGNYEDVYEEDWLDDVQEQVKEELGIETELTQNVVTRQRRVKKEKAESDQLPPPKKAGRPKKANTKVPRRKRKFPYRQFYCWTCGTKFLSKQEYDNHKKEAHKDPESWICEVCGKSFIHRASHYSHVKSHLPPNYACDKCDYKTWHKYDLVKHVRIHNGEKLYQCEYCTASFYTTSNLSGHIRNNHMKERPYKCSLCSMAFFDSTKLNRHTDSHHELKRFECSVCHASYTRRDYWKKHLAKVHSIIIPPQRPGRQKTNAVVGEDLVNQPFELIIKKVDQEV